MKRLMLMMAGMASAVFGAFGATTVYVDRTNGSDLTGDGTSEHPYATIQKGVDEVAASGTVRVLPGIYDEGEKLGASGASNRVYITKSVTLQATSTCRTNTVIRGAYDLEATDNAWNAGPRAVRCVEVASGCTVYINGFTLEKGRTCWGNGSDNQNIGGLVFGSGYSGSGTYIQDCILRDGAARSGGAVHQVRLIRCFVTGCSSWNAGNCMRSSGAYHTIFARNATHPDANTGGGLFAYAQEAVNCTVVENRCAFFNSNNISAINCAVFGNSHGVGQPEKCYNCVSDDPLVTGGSNCRQAVYSDCIYAPLLNDFRLLADGACVGAGSDDGRLNNTGGSKDFFGTDLNRSSVNVGAVQATTTAQGAPIFLTATFVGTDLAASGLDTGDADRFGGYPKMIMGWNTAVTYFRRNVTPVYPDAVKLVLPSAPDSYGNIAVTNTASSIVTIGWDNTVYLPVYRTGVTNMLIKVSNESQAVWVDRNSTAEGTETGSAEHPFRVLQDGVTKLGNNSGVVFVKPGDYDEGGTTIDGLTSHKSRLVLKNGSRIRVVAVEGPGVTSIVGASDPSDPVNGFGPNACRCVASYKNWNFVSGFTLRGGRTGAVQANDDADKLVRRGGAAQRMYTATPEVDRLFLTDCVITDCTGREGSIGWGPTFVRCRITNSGRWAGASFFVNSDVISSAIWNCGPDEPSDATAVFGSATTFYNTSLGPVRATNIVDQHAAYNSVLASGQADLNWNASQGGYVKYSLYESASVADGSFSRGTGQRHEGLVKGKAVYRDAANGGLELTTLSDARNLASYDFMYKGCPIDVNGVPYVGSSDGRFHAGAFATVARGVSFETDYANGISPAEARGFDDDGEIELTASANRPFLGFRINDTTVVPAGHVRTYTLKASDLPEGEVTVRALYGSAFYVSPTGSDENSGFYEDEPLQKISTAFANSLSSDEVIALPGDYSDEQGATAHTGGATVKSRVIVPSGRTLRSRDGAAATRILGKASVENKDGLGLGPDAVRCAYLNSNAKLIGFTLKDGRTDKNGSDDTIDTKGGGVFAANTSADVEDCVFDNCASVRGGSAYSVLVRSCRFVNGKSPHYAGIFLNACLAYRCSFGSSYSSNSGASAVYGGSSLEGCTICPDCCTTGANYPAGITLSGGSAVMVNTIVANGGSVSANAGNIRSCAFRTGAESKVSGLSNDAPSVFGEVEVDAVGVPVVGRNVGIDAASTATVVRKDLAGCTHYWNGAWDMGAYEADWRPHYAASLNRHGVTVSEVSSNAVEQLDGRIKLVDGRLTAEWANATGREVPYLLRYEVAGAGTLTVRVNDVIKAQIDASAGPQTLAFANDLASNELSFEYEGAGVDDAGALIGRFERLLGTILIIR